jgi:hypothetical protein
MNKPLQHQHQYVMGHSADELERLALQDEVIGPTTESRRGSVSVAVVGVSTVRRIFSNTLRAAQDAGLGVRGRV